MDGLGSSDQAGDGLNSDDLVWAGQATGGRGGCREPLGADRWAVDCWSGRVRDGLGLSDHARGFPQCGGWAVSRGRNCRRAHEMRDGAREDG